MSRRRAVPSPLLLLMLFVLLSSGAHASVAPRTVPPPTVSSPPRIWNGDPDMPEGFDPRHRPAAGLDARTAPVSFWLTLLRECGIAFGI